MLELRHVKIYKARIFESSDSRGLIQEKLQTISTISDPSVDFLDRIPNIKNMRITISLCIFDLHHLHKLETLKLSGYLLMALVSPSSLRLPPSLRKLSLTRCYILGEFMKNLSLLPNLEVLKLQECELEGGEPQEWDATQQEFCALQLLLLARLQLVQWQADETNFPRLRHLVIRGCSELEEIPSGIGEIPTLQTIELDECSPSLVASAKLIVEEQCELGNYDLHLHTSAC